MSLISSEVGDAVFNDTGHQYFPNQNDLNDLIRDVSEILIARLTSWKSVDSFSRITSQRNRFGRFF